MPEKIAVVGLGYVGLPVALAFAKKCGNVIGFDVDKSRVQKLCSGIDVTEQGLEVPEGDITFSAEPKDLSQATVFVVCVPTPVDENHRPDLTPLESASKVVAGALTKGAVVVYESTVYPGVTEEFCGPILEEHSGLQQGRDFFLGYSPERINPGDREHTIERIVKVVSGEDAATLERVATLYEQIIDAGVHRASSIKVAEAAKVIENTQRDLNIALMNELAIIFDRMEIPSRDVFSAAGTKWNFLPFRPGLVGGHCIGVDPYYLTTKAEQLGYHPEVILAGRRINDGMGQFVAKKTVKLMAKTGRKISGARVGILGLAFKENVGDLRNSRVPSIAAELKEYGVEVLVHDPLCDGEEAEREYGVTLRNFEDLQSLDACILAVAHEEFLEKSSAVLFAGVKDGGVFVDVKAVFEASSLPKNLIYWSL